MKLLLVEENGKSHVVRASINMVDVGLGADAATLMIDVQKMLQLIKIGRNADAVSMPKKGKKPTWLEVFKWGITARSLLRRF